MKKFKDIIENTEEWLGHTDYLVDNRRQPSYLDIHTKRALSDHENDALEHYSETGYLKMNNHLRGFDEHPQEDFAIKHLSKAISKHTTTHPAHVWRGISHTLNANPGDILHDKGFVSTSMNPGKAIDFSGKHIMHIKVPKGSKALYRNHYYNNSYEDEVILPRNSRFRYDGSEKKTGNKGKVLHIHHLTHIPEGSE